MTTERFSFTGDAGTNHYLAIFNAAGLIFDWNDSTFKALSTPPPNKAAIATEQADLGGSGKSAYIKDVDLSLLNNTTTPAKFRADWYTDSGATVLVSNTLEFSVKKAALWDDVLDPRLLKYVQLLARGDAANKTDNADELAAVNASGGSGAGAYDPETDSLEALAAAEYVCQFGINVKSTEGKVLQLRAWLEQGGQFVDLSTVDAAATISIEITEHGSGVVQVTAGSGEVPNADGVFEFEYDMEAEDAGYPNLVDDRGYRAVVTITENSTAHTTVHEFAAIGGE